MIVITFILLVLMMLFVLLCFFRGLKLISRKFAVAMSGTGMTSCSNFGIYKETNGQLYLFFVKGQLYLSMNYLSLLHLSFSFQGKDRSHRNYNHIGFLNSCWWRHCYMRLG